MRTSAGLSQQTDRQATPRTLLWPCLSAALRPPKDHQKNNSGGTGYALWRGPSVAARVGTAPTDAAV